MKTNYYLTVVAVLGVTLSACGGGGDDSTGDDGVDVTGMTYPDCTLGANGTSDVAGCWVSEECGSGVDTESTWAAKSVRYVAWITQDQTTPTVKGHVDDYYLRYDNETCDGLPFSILDQKEALAAVGFEWIKEYEIPGFETCTDPADGSIVVECTAFDLLTDYKALGSDTGGQSWAYGAYDHGTISTRLCLSGNIFNEYNPADPSDFGFVPTGELTRLTQIDYVNCLTRFTPP